MNVRILLFVLVMAAATAPGFGQKLNVSKLKLGGVGLDSTYAQVIKALGKPQSDPKPVREECVGGRERSVRYPGVTFQLMDAVSRDGKTFEVTSFQVTSAKYPVSGLKVGDDELAVRRLYGANFTKGDDESGAVVWTYEFADPNNPGFTHVYISRGKVVKILSGYMVC